MNTLKMPVTDHLLSEILKCPNCGGNIDGQLCCTSCSRQIKRIGSCLNLLPDKLAKNKINENLIFQNGSNELKKFDGMAWRKLVGQLEIERFDKEILPILPTGNFLELGGESCWASAIYKTANPSSTVFATDVSINAVNNIAIPLAKMFPYIPNVFAAVDAEVLPFKDSSMDCIFIQSAMHHLPDPVAMLTEVKRVLKINGLFVAVDHVVPKHFRFLFISVAKLREKNYGIQENLVSFTSWKKWFLKAGIPIDSLTIYKNPNYQRNPYFVLLGRMVSLLPGSISCYLFPVGLYVNYIKR